jgi:hypothetical protein
VVRFGLALAVLLAACECTTERVMSPGERLRELPPAVPPPPPSTPVGPALPPPSPAQTAALATLGAATRVTVTLGHSALEEHSPVHDEYTFEPSGATVRVHVACRANHVAPTDADTTVRFDSFAALLARLGAVRTGVGPFVPRSRFHTYEPHRAIGLETSSGTVTFESLADDPNDPWELRVGDESGFADGEATHTVLVALVDLVSDLRCLY